MHCAVEGVVDLFKQAIVAPDFEIIVDAIGKGEVMGHTVPHDAVIQHIADGVEYLAELVFTWSPFER